MSTAPRARWIPATPGFDLHVAGEIVARVRPSTSEGWFWYGLKANSCSGPGARSIPSLDEACAAVEARARARLGVLCFEGRRTRPTRLCEALDRAQPGLAAVALGERVNLFCRLHLLGTLPAEVRAEDLELVRAAVELYQRTGCWEDGASTR